MSRENELLRVMSAMSGRKVTILTPAKIVEAVCSTLDIEQGEMESQIRSREITECRFIIAHMLNTKCGFNETKIGTYIGKRERTTVIHSLKQFADLNYSSGDFREKVRMVDDRLEELCG